MYEHLEQEYDNPEDLHSDKQEEIFDAFENTWKYMEKYEIGALTKLAKQYYGTDKAANYSGQTWEETQVWDSVHLYTLIKYQGRDTLIPLGTGEFNTAVFTKRNIPRLAWFSHSPLPLFVVSARAEQEHKDENPKQFLNEHTLIYSPKWGQAELRITSKQKEHPINYGNSNGIMNYHDAFLTLQNAHIHKIFPNDASFEEFVAEMKKLKEYAPEKLKMRIDLKEQFLPKDPNDKKFRDKIVSCLGHLSDGNIKNIYKLVQSFDIFQQVFIKPLHKKNK